MCEVSICQDGSGRLPWLEPVLQPAQEVVVICGCIQPVGFPFRFIPVESSAAGSACFDSGTLSLRNKKRQCSEQEGWRVCAGEAKRAASAESTGEGRRSVPKHFHGATLDERSDVFESPVRERFSHRLHEFVAIRCQPNFFVRSLHEFGRRSTSRQMFWKRLATLRCIWLAIHCG